MKIPVRSIALAVVLAAALPAAAQTYPARAVRVVVPYAAGGNTDFTARTVAGRLTEVFGQQVIVENRPGGATNIGSELVAKAPPDGYTLLMGGASNAREIVSRLNVESSKILASPEVKNRRDGQDLQDV